MKRSDRKTNENTISKNPVGRPTKYLPIFVEQAEKLIVQGFTEKQVFTFFGIAEKNGIEWKKKYPEFRKALERGKVDQVKIAEKKLIDLARGYKFKSEKIVVVSDGNQIGSHVERVKTVERVEPNLRAIEYILNNRKPRKKYPDDGWGDIKEVNIGNIDGEPFIIEIK